ncbi:hypothetical protein ACIBOV_28075, partial [Micromonospora chersina]|uniref:hypothetical protein n=1 Tax=Micromonospora chersina TaxID=47854 RepID=UPI0037B41F3E
MALILSMIVSLFGGIGVLSATPAAAADTATISGVVVDGGDLEQKYVIVDVLAAGTNNPVTSVKTGQQGQFEVMVVAGRQYDLRFTPPDGSGLRTYLATGVDPSSAAPLRIILKPITVIRLDGVVRDGKGNRYARTSLMFTPAGGGAITYAT